MNETTPFFQSNAFYLILGLFIGTMLGFFVAALCASSGQASRDEERMEEEARLKKEIAKMSKEDKLISIIRGKPDRD